MKKKSILAMANVAAVFALLTRHGLQLAKLVMRIGGFSPWEAAR